MRKVAFLFSVVVLLMWSGHARAVPCESFTNILFCDDFDLYCTPAPTPPNQCPFNNDAGADNDAFWAIWPLELPECTGANSEHALKYVNFEGRSAYMVQVAEADTNPPEYGARVSRHSHDLTTEILARPENTSHLAAINGAGDISVPLTTTNTVPPDYVDSMSRTLRPQALRGGFIMKFDGSGSYSRMMYYTELCLDEDRAPLDYDTVFCAAGCYGTHCRDAGTNPRLRLNGDGQVHASFALGVVAWMDRDPCDLDTGWYPTEWRLAVYDGLNWSTFKGGQFGIPNLPDPHPADLYPKDGGGNWNLVQFAIGADYVEVRLRNAQTEGLYPATNPHPYTIARVPRQYKGPFNRIALGPGKSLDKTVPTCENFGDETTPAYKCVGGSNHLGTCTTAAECPAATEELCPKVEMLGNNMYADEVQLYDGIFQAGHTGACCNMADMSCTDVQSADCIGTDKVFRGESTKCTDTKICCRDPFARIADNDADVDQADFAVFQACYTGPGTFTLSAVCKCLDHDLNGSANNVIDADDWAAFERCASGSGIPAEPTCDLP
jgi:hypothetical protein